jgi:hypothetical protein
MFRNYMNSSDETSAVEQVYPGTTKKSSGWFIKMGFAGFNSPTNNRNGYASRAAAEKACLRYQNKGK